MKLAIDLCCGLGGWTDGLLAEGWAVRGYDIEAHEYGDEKYPADLVLKSILDLDGAECADADLIVASPPCTEYSYMAMPWSRAKQIARALRGEDEFPEGYKGSRAIEDLNALFDACFRIQRQASEAAGRPIPMVLENVKGAQPWVGPAPWNFGSFYLWGDIPALMPGTVSARKNSGGSWFNIGSPGQKVVGKNPAHEIAREMAEEGRKNPGFRFDGSGKSFQTESVKRHVSEGRKGAGAGAGAEWFDGNLCKLSSKSAARKAASAKIAKIPFALSSHIARVYSPTRTLGEAA